MFVGVLILVLVESMFGGSMLCLKVIPSVVVSSSSWDKNNSTKQMRAKCAIEW
jgi:hypothetical protein